MLSKLRGSFSRNVSALLIAVLFFEPLTRVKAAEGRLDANNDGFPDIWQSKYQVPPFGLAEQGDDDFDGFANISEALAGTNPYQHSSLLEPEVVKLQTGGTEITWDSQQHKAYRLEVSYNQLTWIPWGEEQLGTGNRITVVLPEDFQNSRIFFRVIAKESPDSDGDGLTDWEENYLGTDRFKTDSDGDSVSDSDEVVAGTVPTNPSSVPARIMVMGGNHQRLEQSSLFGGQTVWETIELITVKLVDSSGLPIPNRELEFRASPTPPEEASPEAFGFYVTNDLNGSWRYQIELGNSATQMTDEQGMVSLAFRTSEPGVTNITVKSLEITAAQATIFMETDDLAVAPPVFFTGLSPDDHLTIDSPQIVGLGLPDEGSSAVIHYTSDGSEPSLSSTITLHDKNRRHNPLIINHLYSNIP